MTKRSDRFLRAFAQVEDALRQITDGSKHYSFGKLVKMGKKQYASVRAVADDLFEYADLRNAIVHERGGGYVIAEPHEETVSRLERIVDRIVNPPKAEQFVGEGVALCRKNDPVGAAARKMLEGSFSQLPVKKGDRIVDVLTTNTIARWIASRFSPEMNLLEEEPVEVVLSFREEFEVWEVVPRSALVAELIEAFQERSKVGRRLVAVLVTHSGKATEEPLGIITQADLPELYASAEA